MTIFRASRDQTKAWFQQLTECAAAPGFEDAVRALMKAYVQENNLIVEWKRDRLGGLFAIPQAQDPNKPTVLLAGHMDEVALLVTQITENGLLRFQALGGWSASVLPAQRMQLITPEGALIGVIASTPPHLLDDASRNKAPQLEQLLLDIGASSKAHAQSLGVRPGQVIVPICPFTSLAGDTRWMAKAWDNRYGVGLAMEMLAELHDQALHVNAIYGATVQEEVGLRGAEAAARMHQPDVAFVLDCSPANDAFGGQGMGKLGGGVLIRLMDRTMITSPRMIQWIIDVAEEEKIPYQFYTSPGGTDAGQIHQANLGIPTAVIGICARYIHSAASIIDPQDYFYAKQLLLALMNRLDMQRVQWLCGIEETV